MRTYGLTDYYVQLSLHDPNQPEKYGGDPDVWERAERELRAALDALGIRYVPVLGEAAFMVPKQTSTPPTYSDASGSYPPSRSTTSSRRIWAVTTSVRMARNIRR
jgi:hypothetical protein